ncbi:MAG: PRC-barrel domain-containing protein [Bacteroidota bacterium]
MSNTKNKPATFLYKLSELNDFEVSPNNPDVRGWTLIGLDGERIGEVDELIVDTEAEKVRYLAVEVDKDVAQGSNHHILVPIGNARLHKNDNNVLVEGLSRSNVNKYPMFDGETITPEYEQLLRSAMQIDDWQTGSPATTTGEENLFPPARSLSQVQLDQMQAELDARREDHYQLRQEQSTNRAAAQQSIISDTSKLEQRSRQELEDALKVARAERDVALKERDIARAERDIMRLERDQAFTANQGSAYNHEHFDDTKFYENRRE